jgi:hypothetical protein
MPSWLVEHKFTFDFVRGIGHRAVPSTYSAKSVSWLHSYSGALGENYFDYMITDNKGHGTI